jgi:hypothetical protein
MGNLISLDFGEEIMTPNLGHEVDEPQFIVFGAYSGIEEWCDGKPEAALSAQTLCARYGEEFEVLEVRVACRFQPNDMHIEIDPPPEG